MEADQEILSQSIEKNLNALNKNRCVKLLKKQFYKSLLTNDITLQFQTYTKLFIKLLKVINKFSLPTGLNYNFNTNIFFADSDNKIYFITTLSTFSTSPPINSSNNTNAQFIQGMFNLFKLNSLITLPVQFINFIASVNSSNNKSFWQTSTLGTQTIHTINSGSTTTYTTNGTASSVSYTGVTINPSSYNGYTGLRFPATNTNQAITFTAIPNNTLFGLACVGGGGGRNGSYFGGGGGGCFYSNNLTNDIGITIELNTPYNFIVGYAGGNTDLDISGYPTSITLSPDITITCYGGKGTTSSSTQAGSGGICNLFMGSYGFAGGTGSSSSNNSGGNANYPSSYLPIGANGSQVIPFLSEINTIGGGGGTTVGPTGETGQTDSTYTLEAGSNGTANYIYATPGSGYGGVSYSDSSTPASQWPSGTSVSSYGGGAGTSYDSITNLPKVSETGIDGSIFLWWYTSTA